jgi:excisionase family DNA binding protein
MSLELFRNDFVDDLRCFVEQEVRKVMDELILQKQEEVSEYLTIKEACSYLRVSRSTLDELCKQEGVPISKYYIAGMPRLKKSELDYCFIRASKSLVAK